VRQRLKKSEVKKLIERGAPTSGGKGMHPRPALSRLTQLVQQEVVPTQRSKGNSYVALGNRVGNCRWRLLKNPRLKFGSRPSCGRAARAEIVRIGVVHCTLSCAELSPAMPDPQASCPHCEEPMKLVHTIPPLAPEWPPLLAYYCASCCHAETKHGRRATDR
jgi:hypothetical protein